MSDMKCPFCQQELERNDLDVQMFGCENQNCKHSIHYDTAGTKELWKELIRTRKALDIAVDAIDVISLKYHKDTPSIFLIKYAQNAKAEITALEQKDVK